MSSTKKASIIGLLANIFLFIIKATAGFLSGSIAVISDAFNSFTDIIASISVFISVKIGLKKADSDHPFGHSRAEPIAALIVAIFTCIVGFEIIKEAFVSFFEKPELTLNYIPFLALLISIAVKLVLYFYFKLIGQRENSPAISATSIDARNDVLASSLAFIGILGAKFNFPYLDPIAAILIGLFIIYSGYQIGAENIDYLMGKAADPDLTKKIKAVSKEVAGVIGIHDIRSQYIGNFIHVELHLEISKKITTEQAHEIEKKVRKKVEALGVKEVFIHLDPISS